MTKNKSNAPDQRAAHTAGLRRRRAASWRLPPLDDGHRDPHRWRDPETTIPGLLGWADAVHHLRALGYRVADLVPPHVRAAGRAHHREITELRDQRRRLERDHGQVAA